MDEGLIQKIIDPKALTLRIYCRVYPSTLCQRAEIEDSKKLRKKETYMSSSIQQIHKNSLHEAFKQIDNEEEKGLVYFCSTF